MSASRGPVRRPLPSRSTATIEVITQKPCDTSRAKRVIADSP